MHFRGLVPALLALLLLPFGLGAEINASAAAAHAAHVEKSAVAKPKKKAPPARDPEAYRYVDEGAFGAVAVYRPVGESRGLVLFASGDGGWSLGVLDMAREATKLGYWVAGFSTPAFLKGLDAIDGECADADGLLRRSPSVSSANSISRSTRNRS